MGFLDMFAKEGSKDTREHYISLLKQVRGFTGDSDPAKDKAFFFDEDGNVEINMNASWTLISEVFDFMRLYSLLNVDITNRDGIEGLLVNNIYPRIDDRYLEMSTSKYIVDLEEKYGYKFRKESYKKYIQKFLSDTPLGFIINRKELRKKKIDSPYTYIFYVKDIIKLFRYFELDLPKMKVIKLLDKFHFEKGFHWSPLMKLDISWRRTKAPDGFGPKEFCVIDETMWAIDTYIALGMEDYLDLEGIENYMIKNPRMLEAGYADSYTFLYIYLKHGVPEKFKTATGPPYKWLYEIDQKLFKGRNSDALKPLAFAQVQEQSDKRWNRFLEAQESGKPHDTVVEVAHRIEALDFLGKLPEGCRGALRQ
jgi:hypothetical protein